MRKQIQSVGIPSWHILIYSVGISRKEYYQNIEHGTFK